MKHQARGPGPSSGPVLAETLGTSQPLPTHGAGVLEPQVTVALDPKLTAQKRRQLSSGLRVETHPCKGTRAHHCHQPHSLSNGKQGLPATSVHAMESGRASSRSLSHASAKTKTAPASSAITVITSVTTTTFPTSLLPSTHHRHHQQHHVSWSLQCHGHRHTASVETEKLKANLYSREPDSRQYWGSS